MTTQALTLSAFLEARIDEDRAAASPTAAELNANTVNSIGGHRAATLSPEILPRGAWSRFRVLFECEAKRRIVERHRSRRWHPRNAVDICAACGDSYPCADLRDLASVYSDHPDFRPEWADQA